MPCVTSCSRRNPTLAALLALSVACTSAAANAAPGPAESYKGWVKLESGYGGEKAAAWLNTEDGTHAKVETFAGKTTTSWVSPAKGEWWAYRDGELRVGRAAPDAVNVGIKPERLRVEQAVAELAASYGVDVPAPAREAGGLDRYDLVPGKAAAKPAEGVGPARSKPVRLTVWGDPKTGLIVKSEQEVEPRRAGAQSTWTVAYTYGPAAAAPDVYALGVPKDAKVIDARPDKAALDLLAAVGTARKARRLGDYVAVVTGTESQYGPESRRYVQVYARQADQWTSRTFSLTEHMKPVDIEGWPAPTLETVEGRFKGAAGADGKLWDGQTLWSWAAAPDDTAVSRYGKEMLPNGPETLGVLPRVDAEIPTPDPWTKVTAIEDAGHAGLKGIKVEAVVQSLELDPRMHAARSAADEWGLARRIGPGQQFEDRLETRHVETLVWVDPARGYTATEWVQKITLPEKRGTETTTITYADFQKLTDGTVYPGRVETKMKFDYGGGRTGVTSAALTVRIAADAKPPAWLFQVPKGRQAGIR